MAHPDQKSGCIIPHLIVPSLIHTFHHFDIQHLCLLAEFFQSGWFSVLCIHWILIINRVGIRRFLTEEMFVPYIVIIILQLLISRQRPPVFFRNKLFDAFKCRESGRSYFCTHTVTVINTIRISRCIKCQITAWSFKMVSWRLISPPTTSGQSILIGARLIHTVIIVLLRNHFTQVIIQIRCRVRFISSTPNSNRRMVSEASDFIKGIRFKCFRLRHVIVCYI